MADSRHIAKYWKRYNSPTNGNEPIWMKLETSYPLYVRHDAVAMATAAA